EPDDDLAADMYEFASQHITNAGYEQYEISNWARPGKQCRHNLQYWLNLPYAGFGPGAHGFAEGIRYSIELSPHRYVQALEAVSETYQFPYSPVVDNADVVSRETEIAETLIMGLRLTQHGIERTVFEERFGIDSVDLHRDTIERYTQTGLLHVDDDRVQLTE